MREYFARSQTSLDILFYLEERARIVFEGLEAQDHNSMGFTILEKGSRILSSCTISKKERDLSYKIYIKKQRRIFKRGGGRRVTSIDDVSIVGRTQTSQRESVVF
jgi:hypothetical protein